MPCGSPRREPVQHFGVEHAAATRTVMVATDVNACLTRPLERGQADQGVAVSKTDDLTVIFENEPLVRLLGRGDTPGHLVGAGASNSQLIVVSSTYGR